MGFDVVGAFGVAAAGIGRRGVLMKMGTWLVPGDVWAINISTIRSGCEYILHFPAAGLSEYLTHHGRTPSDQTDRCAFPFTSF